MKQPITIDLQDPPKAVTVLREDVEDARTALDALADALADATLDPIHIAYLAMVVERAMFNASIHAGELVSHASEEGATA